MESLLSSGDNSRGRAVHPLAGDDMAGRERETCSDASVIKGCDVRLVHSVEDAPMDCKDMSKRERKDHLGLPSRKAVSALYVGVEKLEKRRR